jgi:hypothetical protein
MQTANATIRRDAPISPPPFPRLAGALAGLEIVCPGHLPAYRRAMAAGGQLGWSYYFGNLMAASRPGRGIVLLGEDSGSVCVFRWSPHESGEKLEIMLAPAPMNAAVLRRCIERANEFNHDRSARILRIDEMDAAAVAAVPGLSVREHKPQFLFSPATYGDLGGGKFRTIRRYVAKIEAEAGLEVVPLDVSRLDACRDLLARWGERHRERLGTGGGLGTSMRAIDLGSVLARPDLDGEVVLIGGRLVAYALWGEIRPGVGAFFDAKCETAPTGLGIFHRYHFLSRQRQFEIINDGSDVGREGLRQLKNSLRPVGFHVEHRATQEAPAGSLPRARRERRIAYTEDKTMNNVAQANQVPDTRVFEKALPAELFTRLVSAVRAIGDERLKHNYTTTFWFPRGSAPRNVAEEAVLQLARLADPPPSCVGMEWWLGRLAFGEKLRYHFDRDMTIRRKLGQYVTPIFGSVMYLNSYPSSPTVVLNQVTSPDGRSKVPAKAEIREVVQAVANRYMVFRGNIRHGVIPEKDAGHAPTDDLRLTLLVNYWDRRPMPPICFDYDGTIYGDLTDRKYFRAAVR